MNSLPKQHRLKCKNYPLIFNEDKGLAKSHFAQFGKLKKITFKSKLRLCLVEYADSKSLLQALNNAGDFNGERFQVELDKMAPKRVKKDPDWTDDPEVQAELEAMGGSCTPKEYNLRPEKMIVEEVDLKAEKPKLKRSWKLKDTTSSNKLKGKLGSLKKGLSPEQMELVQLIKQPANTVEEKYRCLDARDKLIRIILKQKGLAVKSSATVGTCPDMCPEKERLMRETQHQVALYEQEPGGRGMNQNLAVKQYSRSSADQETPLPHELRPVKVLQMTMGYLMHQIMDLCESPDVNLAEWYHFLWDRTRGIRKDITQQDLVSQGSVELVEQCARFHIHCSARLVAEDPSVFDHKINTENLTKCLQTLKYMYHDLQIKGEVCPNEAEFRAYIILLNLNDGNFMWEVQQLQQHIQKSTEVRFALQVYSAIDKNNFVRFFKLVKSTTYLNACILMRYFVQIRLTALRTLLKCFSQGKTLYPLSDIQSLLGFEDKASASDFLYTYGLKLTEDSQYVILERARFAIPQFPFMLDRSICVVESKRIGSVGETVCGKALPPRLFETHIPENSFDWRNLLILEGKLERIDLDMLTSQGLQEVKEPEPEVEIEVPEVKPIEVFKKEPKVAPPQQEVKKGGFHFDLSAPKPLFQPNPFKTISEDVVRVQSEQERLKKEHEMLQKQIEEQRLRLEEEKEKKRLLEEKLKQERIEEKRRMEEKAKQEKAKAEEERRIREGIERAKQEKLKQEKLAEEKRLREAEISKTVKVLMQFMLGQVEETVKKDKLEEISKNAQKRRLVEAFSTWRKNVIDRKRKKSSFESPMWISNRSVREEAEQLKTSSQDLTLLLRDRYISGAPYRLEVSANVKAKKIDLFNLTYANIINRLFELEMIVPKSVFWKVTISLPEVKDTFFMGVEEALDDYIQWVQRNDKVVLVEQFRPNPAQTLTYGVCKEIGPREIGTDTDGIIFVSRSFSCELETRLFSYLNKIGVKVRIPIVIVLQEPGDYSKLSKLVDDNIICGYKIICNTAFPLKINEMVDEGLIYLSGKFDKPPSLELDTFYNFVDKNLCSEMWRRANSFAKWNSSYKKCLRDPNLVLGIYNEALVKIKNLVTCEILTEYACFPEVFMDCVNPIPDYLPCNYKYFPRFWKELKYRKKLEGLFDKMVLPGLDSKWPPENEFDLEITISKYCTKVFDKPEKPFYKIMAILLKDIDPSENFKDVKDVIWTDVVEVISKEKLSQLDLSLSSEFCNKSVFNQYFVVYDAEAVKDYEKSDWFYVNNKNIKRHLNEYMEEQICKRSRIEVKPKAVDIDELVQGANKVRSDPSSKLKELKEIQSMLDDLENSMVVYRKISSKFEDNLKSSIRQGK